MMSFLSFCLALATLIAPCTVKASDAMTTADANATTPDAATTEVSPDAASSNASTAGLNETTASTSDTPPTNATSSEVPTSEEATTTTASEETSTTDSEATGQSTKGDCIEATLPNILGIGKCLGDDLNMCVDGQTVLPGLLSLVNCTVISVIQNLSVRNALLTIKNILFVVIKKLVPLSSELFEDALTGQERTSDNITDNVCQGEIKIGFPNSLGKCLNETLKFCADGNTVDTPIIDSLVSAVTCLLTDLLETNPRDLLKQLLCDISRALEALSGAIVFGEALQKVLTDALCEKNA